MYVCILSGGAQTQVEHLYNLLTSSTKRRTSLSKSHASSMHTLAFISTTQLQILISLQACKCVEINIWALTYDYDGEVCVRGIGQLDHYRHPPGSSMPTCRPTTLRPPTLAGISNKPHSSRARKLAAVRKAGGCTATRRRYASAAVAVKVKEAPGQGEVQENAQVQVKEKGNVKEQVPKKEKPSVKTLLYKTERFLPRVLEPTHPSSGSTTSLAFWQGILGRAYDSLNTPGAGAGAGVREKEKARIVGESYYYRCS